MLTTNHRKESLSQAYVQAIAGFAGASFNLFARDYGMDACLRAVDENDASFNDAGMQVDLQLKSTTRAILSEAGIQFDLDVDSYNEMRRSNVWCPRILVVLILPSEEADWLHQSAEELILRKSAWWLSLRGFPATPNTASIRVAFPREQLFTPESIHQMFERMRNGGVP